jgi:hypothetical protein
VTLGLPTALRTWIAPLAGLALLAALYCWTALPPHWQEACTDPAAEHYNLLADALLAGQTSLLISPRPQLLALDDPYDPLKNHQRDAQGKQYCLHDAALYKGKYYLYFGVTPAVVLFAPYRLLTGECLPTRVGALVFALGGLAFSSLLVNILVTRLSPGVRSGTRLLLILAAGCCNCVPFVLRSPRQWEMAIISAFCFVMAAMYFLARGGLGDRLRRGSLLYGSLCLGLAVGCRPNMALVALPVFGIALVWLAVRRRQQNLSRRDLVGVAAVLLGPWSLCLLLLGAYNYVRFGSFTEFGIRYNLVGATVRVVDMPVLDWHRLGKDLWFYLWTPPHFTAHFPYVRLTSPTETWTLPGYFGFDAVAGLLLSTPFVWCLALLPLIVYRAWRQSRCAYLAALAVFLGAGLLELLCVSCFGECMRYEVDFAGLFVLAALLVLLDLETWYRTSPIMKLSVRTTAVLGIGAACLFQVGISIEGQRFEKHDLAVRDRLRHVFPRFPVPSRSLKVRLDIVFPEDISPGRCEPLIELGKSRSLDFLSIRYVGDDCIVLALNHVDVGSPAQETRAIHVVPGRPYALEADLRPRDSRVVCRLDGEEVLNIEAPVYAIHANAYAIGENYCPFGLFTSQRFTGLIRAESVDLR